MINIKSKTHNYGALIGIFGGLQAFLPQVREFIPEDQFGWIFIFVGVGVIVLRNMTTTPINQK